MRRFAFIIAIIVTVGLITTGVAATPQAGIKTVWNGIYSDAQATRGQQLYLENCSGCHGEDLDGVAILKGFDFMERWREINVKGLYDFVSQSMPRVRNGSPNRPGSLPEATYVSIISYIFKANGFPAGQTELTRDTMKNIMIELKAGPSPLPNSALVQVAGCMTARNGNWLITRASDPKRIANTDASKPEELAEARRIPQGELQIPLANLGFLGPDFDPTTKQNQWLLVKGTLVRQQGNYRINVTSIEVLEESCN